MSGIKRECPEQQCGYKQHSTASTPYTFQNQHQQNGGHDISDQGGIIFPPSLDDVQTVIAKPPRADKRKRS